MDIFWYTKVVGTQNVECLVYKSVWYTKAFGAQFLTWVSEAETHAKKYFLSLSKGP